MREARDMMPLNWKAKNGGNLTCMLVHKLLALWDAVMILIAVVVIESTNKRRYKSNNNAVQRR